LKVEEEESIIQGPVTLQNWARTRKQKILLETSFESKEFDIYNPKFSSDESITPVQVSIDLSEETVSSNDAEDSF